MHTAQKRDDLQTQSLVAYMMKDKKQLVKRSKLKGRWLIKNNIIQISPYFHPTSPKLETGYWDENRKNNELEWEKDPIIITQTHSGATAHESQCLLCPFQYTWSLGTEVHEQMYRSGGQSVFKSPSKLGTNLSTHCSRDEKVELTFPSPEIEPGPVLWKLPLDYLTDLWVMGPARFHCVTLLFRIIKVV
ncbi:hypothetical protein TNCV_4970861 [Trichonephila clavipes]|nr:hypothetical protein TNCV_4970861 [Trichonephila clavipes]